LLILSHRGYWKQPDEKNTEAAFVRSFQKGFGIETDVRDAGGRLVISHDPPAPSADLFSFDAFCALYKRHGNDALPLALNVKADGLQTLLQTALNEHGITNYFVFDMAVPDGLAYLRTGLPVFTRRSEYEREAALYDQATGVWMDCFHEPDWRTVDSIHIALADGKQVCLVSPDLHRRPHRPFWEMLAAAGLHRNAGGGSEAGLLLCTDYPEEAASFFAAAEPGRPNEQTTTTEEQCRACAGNDWKTWCEDGSSVTFHRRCTPRTTSR